MMNLSKLYTFKSTDKVLIDANILIFIFCPLSTYTNKIDNYSDILEALRDSNSKLFLCSTVVSEFINSWLRMDFDKNIQDNERTKNFKRDYRGTARYEIVLNQILKQIEKLYKNYNISQIDDDFGSFDVQNAYTEKNNDFNDLLISHILKKNDLKIFTDDKDFEILDSVRMVR